MRDILPELVGLLTGADARPVALCRVVSTAGSAPRDLGAAMVVTADDTVIGSVSGGCVEGALVHTARQVLDDGTAVVESFGVDDPEDPAPGLTCGGQIEVLVERVEASPERLRQLMLLVDALDARRSIALATTLTGRPDWYLGTSETHEPWRRLDRDVADMLATGTQRHHRRRRLRDGRSRRRSGASPDLRAELCAARAPDPGGRQRLRPRAEFAGCAARHAGDRRRRPSGVRHPAAVSRRGRGCRRLAGPLPRRAAPGRARRHDDVLVRDDP